MSPYLSDFRQDLTYPLRALLRSPGFSLIALLSVALGVTSTTVVFTAVKTDSVLDSDASRDLTRRRDYSSRRKLRWRSGDRHRIPTSGIRCLSPDLPAPYRKPFQSSNLPI